MICVSDSSKKSQITILRFDGQDCRVLEQDEVPLLRKCCVVSAYLTYSIPMDVPNMLV